MGTGLVQRLQRLLAPLLALVALACGDGDQVRPLGTPDLDGGAGGGGGDAGGDAARPCAPGREGCPCVEPGADYFCGWIYWYSGDYVACSPGISTCGDDLLWGECVSRGVTEYATPEQIPGF